MTGKKAVKKPLGWRQKLQTLAGSKNAGRIYMLLALATLLGTTIYWSLRSADLQMQNADQLVNPYMFESWSTFKAAAFPEAHSFLMKWPLFWLIKLLGFSSAAYLLTTLAVVLITVGGLAFILWWVERRSLLVGTLYLALASVLLLVPAQPYAGGLLPVNMAMLATRNLEYLLYIAGLYAVIKSPRLRSWQFAASALILTLVVASDKLFATIGIGGAILALTAYCLTRRWKAATLAARWLAASSLALVAGTLLLWIVKAINLTQIGGSGGPYGLTQSLRDLVLGSYYSLTGIATNLGANPAYDAIRLRDISTSLQTHLLSVSGPAYLINVVIFLAAVLMTLRLTVISLRKTKSGAGSDEAMLSLFMVWTSIAAIGAFVLTNHYYPVDARYLAVSLFALFMALAVSLKKYRLHESRIIIAAAVLIVSIIAGLIGANQTFNSQASALSRINERNKLVSEALKGHTTNVLVGDYWRVMPVRQLNQRQKVMPLGDCTNSRDVLTSRQWQANLNRKSFAYLLSLDKGLTNFPQCTLDQVLAKYGRPNTSTVISGDLSNPKELLLFYDNGANRSSPSPGPLPQKSATVTPIAPDELPNTTCTSPTIMNVVAHQDDDLLFMNPDISRDIAAGRCIRTVYVTAGDDGADRFYWLSRQRGSEAAYSAMYGSANDIWLERIVKLGERQYATVATPKDNPKVTLIFLHLPDGNLSGQGFPNYRSESLTKLESNRIDALHSVDNQSVYTSNDLVAAMATFMHIYQPAEIRTLANYVSETIPDHADHMAVGRYAQRARNMYEQQQFEGRVQIPLSFYIGYPVRERPDNVSGDDLIKKQAAFYNYGRFDAGVCSSAEQCSHHTVYSKYLVRQYRNDY